MSAVVAKDAKKTERVTFRAEAEWVEDTTEAARRHGLSLGAYIRMCVAERREREKATRRGAPPAPEED